MAKSAFSFFVIVLVFSVTNADNVKPSNNLEEELLVLLTKWREGAVETNILKLPSIKAIDIDGVDSYYNANGIKMTFSVGKMQLTGLNTFTLETVNVTHTDDILELSGRINVSTLMLQSDNYSLKGSAYYFYPIRGSGKMTMQFNDIAIWVTVRFVNVGGVTTKVDIFSLDYNISKITANLEKSSFLINEVLNVEGATILKGHRNDIEKSIKSFAIPYANEYLATVSLSDFVKSMLDASESALVIKDRK